MKFYADLHVHSKYSRATSRDCDLEHMAFWAARKGVTVIGTGDFTHPQWLTEIKEKLIPAEPGLFRLKPDLEAQVGSWLDDLGGVGRAIAGEASHSSAAGVPGDPGDPGVRFMLEVEISTIYKKDDKTRKVHHLIYAPDLEKAGRIIDRLNRIGNLASDGRPILGLDSRDLLEITLDAGDGCYLIPAHIWTPWFAVLGSKSGFDSIEHCYGDLSGEIFALETGLSSDPPMNRRLSALDRYTLVSNSDAHSPPKIGREACVFDTKLDYFAIRRALETGVGYNGTVEFFPEEGKYHLDGHRKCGVCLTPQETRDNDGRCPVCGKPVTLGVMHRVHELADRPPPPAPTSGKAQGPSSPASHEPETNTADRFRSLVPLTEVLAEIEGVGPKSKRVGRRYDEMICRLGSELFILEHASADDLKQHGSSLVAEALARMRQGRVIRDSGYDGEYGTIRLFEKRELHQGSAVSLLFRATPEDESSPTPQPAIETCIADTTNKTNPSDRAPRVHVEPVVKHQTPPDDRLPGLDLDQQAAASTVNGPLLIIAGPGTGKTRTLTHRIVNLIQDHQADPRGCLAITFTNRAAQELKERLKQLVPDRSDLIPVMTFHALGRSIIEEHRERLGLPHGFRIADDAQRASLLSETLSVSSTQAARWLKRISLYKRQLAAPEPEPQGNHPIHDPETTQVVDAYQKRMLEQKWIDFDDLLLLPLRLLRDHREIADGYRHRYPWVSIDEYQDIDRSQYELVRLLVPAGGNLCVIGDPDQAIYGFRGSDVRFFQRFEDDCPGARNVHLTRNYRSTRPIIDASMQLIAPVSLVRDRQLVPLLDSPERIQIHGCATERAEAEFVVHTIERMMGGSTFFSLDSDRVESHEDAAGLSFSDFAVLYRADTLSHPLVEALARSGMPFQKRSHAVLADQPTVRAMLEAMGDPTDTDTRPVWERLESAARQISDDYPQADLYLAGLKTLAQRSGEDLASFLSDLAMGVDVDLWDPRADRISMLTLHAAKGLEFPVVFIVGCEDGVVPLHWSANDDADVDEERRLFFVGMTRAKQRLILTHTAKRKKRGKIETAQPSPFLQDIERGLLEIRRHHRPRKTRSRDEQLALFSS